LEFTQGGRIKESLGAIFARKKEENKASIEPNHKFSNRKIIVSTMKIQKEGKIV